MLDKGTLVVCGVAAFVGVTLLASKMQPEEIMHVGCENIYMTRVQLNAELESRDNRRMIAALNEQIKRGNCATTRRGAFAKYGFNSEALKMRCTDMSCQWVIKTNIFEEIKQ
jgi:hypothetical protein